jgi:Ca-activated chloride channel family protein
MARCLGWPERQISLNDIVQLTTDARGWSKYDCARPEWGSQPLLAFTYPSRSSTARSVLYTLWATVAGRPVEQLTLDDVANSSNADYIHRFQTSIDCYVPDTLDLNIKLLSSPACAQFYFIAEDNLVKLYQGKISLGSTAPGVARSLERDMVMVYPKDGAILHNHSAFIVNAEFVSTDQTDAAERWIDFLQEESQQRAFMQEGFRRTTPGPCISPLGSPFSPCGSTPETVIYPDRIDPAVAAAILRAWD